ncbi:MAG TPA: GDP-L-fucose synthase [Alphaproteobacteria bacterium]|nr:GDP-L-fucose synthase [Alphaproteobacteria bacterium]
MAEAGWLDTPFSLEGKSVFVAGHKGLVGAALCERLKEENCTVLTIPRSDLDLRDQATTHEWIRRNKPDVIILAAATVGGIGANATRPADFIYDNLMIEANVIHAAYQAGVQKLLFLGSSCIYPKFAQQPIAEDALLSGNLEDTNRAYAIAKIAGIELCQSYRRQHGCDFIAAMPCNLYGPGDRFDENASHVIPALMLKMHKAKHQVEIWGSGAPLREFLYAADLADGLLFLLKRYSHEKLVNIGSSDEISIKDLAHKIAAVTGYDGSLVFDTDKPDGTPRKLLDSSRIQAAGWRAKTSLDEGLKKTYDWFRQHHS